MKKIAVLIGVVVLSVAWSIPAGAQNSSVSFPPHQMSPAAKKRAKAANKYAKKYAKQQRKVMRKQAKAQRKALKQARNRSIR